MAVAQLGKLLLKGKGAGGLVRKLVGSAGSGDDLSKLQSIVQRSQKAKIASESPYGLYKEFGPETSDIIQKSLAGEVSKYHPLNKNGKPIELGKYLANQIVGPYYSRPVAYAHARGALEAGKKATGKTVQGVNRKRGLHQSTLEQAKSDAIQESEGLIPSEERTSFLFAKDRVPDTDPNFKGKTTRVRTGKNKEYHNQFARDESTHSFDESDFGKKYLEGSASDFIDSDAISDTSLKVWKYLDAHIAKDGSNAEFIWKQKAGLIDELSRITGNANYMGVGQYLDGSTVRDAGRETLRKTIDKIDTSFQISAGELGDRKGIVKLIPQGGVVGEATAGLSSRINASLYLIEKENIPQLGNWIANEGPTELGQKLRKRRQELMGVVEMNHADLQAIYDENLFLKDPRVRVPTPEKDAYHSVRYRMFSRIDNLRKQKYLQGDVTVNPDTYIEEFVTDTMLDRFQRVSQMNEFLTRETFIDAKDLYTTGEFKKNIREAVADTRNLWDFHGLSSKEELGKKALSPFILKAKSNWNDGIRNVSLGSRDEYLKMKKPPPMGDDILDDYSESWRASRDKMHFEWERRQKGLKPDPDVKAREYRPTPEIPFDWQEDARNDFISAANDLKAYRKYARGKGLRSIHHPQFGTLNSVQMKGVEEYLAGMKTQSLNINERALGDELTARIIKYSDEYNSNASYGDKLDSILGSLDDRNIERWDVSTGELTHRPSMAPHEMPLQNLVGRPTDEKGVLVASLRNASGKSVPKRGRLSDEAELLPGKDRFNPFSNLREPTYGDEMIQQHRNPSSPTKEYTPLNGIDAVSLRSTKAPSRSLPDSIDPPPSTAPKQTPGLTPATFDVRTQTRLGAFFNQGTPHSAQVASDPRVLKQLMQLENLAKSQQLNPNQLLAVQRRASILRQAVSSQNQVATSQRMMRFMESGSPGSGNIGSAQNLMLERLIRGNG